MQECVRRALVSLTVKLISLVAIGILRYPAETQLTKVVDKIRTGSNSSWNCPPPNPTGDETGHSPLEARTADRRDPLQDRAIELAHVPCKPPPGICLPAWASCNPASCNIQDLELQATVSGREFAHQVPCYSSPQSCLFDGLHVRVSDLLVLCWAVPGGLGSVKQRETAIEILGS